MNEDEKETKQHTMLVSGCLLHLAVALIAAGFGYYLGWGLGLLLFGGFVGLWSLNVMLKLKKELNDNNGSENSHVD